MPLVVRGSHPDRQLHPTSQPVGGDSLTVGTSPTVTLFVQQTRKTVDFEFENSKTDTEVKEHPFKVEGGY